MRYQRAVQKLRALADACESTNWIEEPFLLEAYVFGDVLRGADSLDWIDVALVVSLPASEVSWGVQPRGAAWLIDRLRLDKGGFNCSWRSREHSVANHIIRGPVRFWSIDGPDDAALNALAARQFSELQPVIDVQSDEDEDVASALSHLRAVCDSYWERNWRADHRGSGRYPENALWEAVSGFLDILDAR